MGINREDQKGDFWIAFQGGRGEFFQVLTLDLAEKPPLPARLLAGLSTVPGVKRAEEWLGRFRDLAELDGDLEDIRRELKAAMTQSMVSVRVPDNDPKSRLGWKYEMMPDATTRLVAIRLDLAYLAGLPPSQQDIRVSHTNTPASAGNDVVDQLRELEACGIGAQEVLDHINRRRRQLGAINVETKTETVG